MFYIRKDLASFSVSLTRVEGQTNTSFSFKFSTPSLCVPSSRFGSQTTMLKNTFHISFELNWTGRLAVPRAICNRKLDDGWPKQFLTLTYSSKRTREWMDDKKAEFQTKCLKIFDVDRTCLFIMIIIWNCYAKLKRCNCTSESVANAQNKRYANDVI